MSRAWSRDLKLPVKTDGEYPLSFTWRGKVHTVCDISDRGGVDTEWWQAGVRREYFVVLTDTGLLAELYFDAIAAYWRIGCVYD